MLDHLVASPQLRQEASEKLLEIAKFLSVEELTESYEQVQKALPRPPQGTLQPSHLLRLLPTDHLCNATLHAC